METVTTPWSQQSPSGPSARACGHSKWSSSERPEPRGTRCCLHSHRWLILRGSASTPSLGTKESIWTFTLKKSMNHTSFPTTTMKERLPPSDRDPANREAPNSSSHEGPTVLCRNHLPSQSNSSLYRPEVVSINSILVCYILQVLIFCIQINTMTELLQCVFKKPQSF